MENKSSRSVSCRGSASFIQRLNVGFGARFLRNWPRGRRAAPGSAHIFKLFNSSCCLFGNKNNQQKNGRISQNIWMVQAPLRFLLFLPAEPVSEVTIKSNLPEAIEHNSTVVLNCSAKGSFLKFTWTNGTKTLVSDGQRITLKEVGPHITCTFCHRLSSAHLPAKPRI